MKRYSIKKIYLIVVSMVLLLPNLFVVVMGIESFPYTCAPMFGHYVDDNTNFYVLKFEGLTDDGEKIDLVDYYGKLEIYFVRHFFSKAYGSIDPINPFSGRLSDNEEDFLKRMEIFFENYKAFLEKEHELFFNRIDISVAKVDAKRNILDDYRLMGYYDFNTESYFSTQ
ncbi:MAG: hypothetical protein AAFO99_03170 [Bacteroidota bacterium]